MAEWNLIETSIVYFNLTKKVLKTVETNMVRLTYGLMLLSWSSLLNTTRPNGFILYLLLHDLHGF